ncbi:MAG: hypothetical protein GX361_00720 [Bacteroidales bacterium]|nr:hypothetical protein [Bacteroidales bacterium]
MPTYKLRESATFRTVFSFTEDVNIAKKLLKNYPDIYVSIGYIEIEISDAFTTNQNGVLFIIPAFRVSDWVELMAYNYPANKRIKNLNYSCSDIELINAIISSRWSARSLANANKEYILICDHLSLTIITDIENYNDVSQTETSILDFLIKDYQNNIATIQRLKSQLATLKISQRRKQLLNNELTNLQTYYTSKIA